MQIGIKTTETVFNFLRTNSLMKYKEKIIELWQSEHQGNLGAILSEILELLDKAKLEGETLPLDLELDIVLNANYALGFGGEPMQARILADLFNRISHDLENGTLNENVRLSQYHRLGCTICGAIISLLSATDKELLSTIYDVIPWEDLTPDTSPNIIISSIIDKLSPALTVGSTSTWKLELSSFIITLQLLYQDLGGSLEESNLGKNELMTFYQSVDRSTKQWSDWKGEWLEKSDHYRFITLMITNSSKSEEIWTEYLTTFL